MKKHLLFSSSAGTRTSRTGIILEAFLSPRYCIVCIPSFPARWDLGFGNFGKRGQPTWSASSNKSSKLFRYPEGPCRNLAGTLQERAGRISVLLYVTRLSFPCPTSNRHVTD